MSTHCKILLTLSFLFLLAIGAAGCISEKPAVDGPKDVIHFPLGVAVHPGGRYAAVVNANFNQAYKNSSVVIIDLANYEIVEKWTVVVGTFAGEALFNHAGTRLFISTRGEMLPQDGMDYEPPDVVVALDVDPVVAAHPSDAELHFSDGTPRDFFVAGSREILEVSPSPFGMAMDKNDRYLYITHIANGEFTVAQDDAMRLTDQTEQADADLGYPIRRCVPISQHCPATSAAGELCGTCESNDDCAPSPVDRPVRCGVSTDCIRACDTDADCSAWNMTCNAQGQCVDESCGEEDACFEYGFGCSPDGLCVDFSGKPLAKRSLQSGSCLINPREPLTEGADGLPGQVFERFCGSFCEVDRTEVNEQGEVIRFGCPNGYRCESLRPLHAVAQRKFSRGGNQVALSPMTGSAYVTHRDANVIGVLRPYWTDGIGYQARVEQIGLSQGHDTRGLAFSPNGDRLYLAARNELMDTGDMPGILVVDTSMTYEGCRRDQFVADTTSCERNRVVDFIETAAMPSNVAFHNNTLYVPLYYADELYAIDVRSREVMAVIDLAPEAFIEEPGIFRESARPYDIAIFENEAGSFALVTNFRAHEVAVVYLYDELGTPIHRVIRKIENRAKLYAEDIF